MSTFNHNHSKLLKKLIIRVISIFIISTNVFGAVTGKISGRVTDLSTGEALIGANVILEGTSMGAATDINGYYVILNISPRAYTLRAMMIGYAPVNYTEVQVNVDLTTTVDFGLTVETIQGEEVTVISERKAIRQDVASSQVNISKDRIEDLPVTSVAGVIGLQAGVEGMSVRRGGTDELAVMLDGASLKDDRTGEPILGIPLSSVQEIMITSGGFSAEYSDLQAGVINVVTREGGLSGYTMNLDYKYSPPAPKHFGPSIFDPDSYYLRPYLDDEVCWTGTDNGAWDEYTQNQYPSFKGWNKLSEDFMTDENPDNDLSPQGAQRLFKWQHRRQGDIVKPDYNIDAGFGGPVPVIGGMLGNLRFYTSFKQERSMYFVPLSRDAYNSWTWTTKLTSDLTKKIKLQFSSFIKEITASSASGVGNPSYFRSLYGVAGIFGGTSQTESKIWYPEYYCLTDFSHQMYSVKLTHMLSQKSFYEGMIEYSIASWDTYPGKAIDSIQVIDGITNIYDTTSTGMDTTYLDTTYRWDYDRDTDIFPGANELWVHEAPFGYDWRLTRSINDYLMGVKTNSRDATVTSHLKMRFNYTNQANEYHQLKSGLEFEYYSFNMSYGAVNKALPTSNQRTEWDRYPYQLSAYIQDKIEAKGWIATVGLRAEYFNPNGEWYDVDPYDKSLYSKNYNPDNESSIVTIPVDGSLTFLPRLGISHPITTNSKLYFNYGHMRQKFLPDQLFGLRRSFGNAMSRIGNPYLPMEKTVMYELGYDQALFNDYLIHAAAYYKDKSDQANSVTYRSADNTVNYSRSENNFYQDIRGLELEVRKRAGNWLTGFVNYTYSVYTSGYFGVRQQYQNPSEQRKYEANVSIQEQYKPLPLPRVNFNVAFHTPRSFGPKFFRQNPIGGWHMAFSGFWKAGAYSTYGGVSGITNNVRWVDSYNVNFKAAKSTHFKKLSVTFICDIYNLFNFKFLSMNALGDQYFNASDATDYYESLQFPKHVYEELSETHLSGNDRKGDYRPLDVEYQAMGMVHRLDSVTDPATIYFVNDLDMWFQLNADGKPEEVNQSLVDELRKEKAYIDNPNIESFMFLNPRDIYFGIKISYNI